MIDKYLLNSAPEIMREPTGGLSHPFLVPGGIFHDEMWDWDCFWITKGYLAAKSYFEPLLYKRFIECAIGSWINFFEQQASDGSVPIMVKGSNPDFFAELVGSRGQANIAKPVFAQYALDLVKAGCGIEWFRPHADKLLAFYKRWQCSRHGRTGLFVWSSDVAIGVDNDPCTYGRPDGSSANLLLNCLFYNDMQAAVALLAQLGLKDACTGLLSEAAMLRESIQRECWDSIDRFFYSVDVDVEDKRDLLLPGLKKGMAFSWRSIPIKIKMFTGFLPLWCGIASDEQAQDLVHFHLTNPNEFELSWGIPSLARNERMYDPSQDSANPSNWLGPVWIVANYMIYEGLLKYGFRDHANKIARRIRHLLEEDLKAHGALHECYNSESGAPNFNAGFLSWNVLALAMR